MDYGTVELYHEFLNQMESCEFNNSLINLATSPSPESFTPPIPSTRHLASIASRQTSPYRPRSPLERPSLSSMQNSDSLRQTNVALSRPQQLLNLNLHLDVNTYYNKLTGLICQIPFHGSAADKDLFQSLAHNVTQSRTQKSFQETFAGQRSPVLIPDAYLGNVSSSASPSCVDLSFNEYVSTGCVYEEEDDDEFYYSDDGDGADLAFDEEDEEDEMNPLAPGLFPKLNIGDDEKFMKFDTLPLTPSYVAK